MGRLDTGLRDAFVTFAGQKVVHPYQFLAHLPGWVQEEDYHPQEQGRGYLPRVLGQGCPLQAQDQGLHLQVQGQGLPLPALPPIPSLNA